MVLTPEQDAQARKEGWKVVQGFLARCYDERGYCPHGTISDVYEHVASRAKKSDWHRDLIMNLPWTPLEDRIAIEEGWRLTMISVITTRLHIFPTDAAAIDFVQRKAEAGSLLHQKAARTIARRRFLIGE